MSVQEWLGAIVLTAIATPSFAADQGRIGLRCEGKQQVTTSSKLLGKSGPRAAATMTFIVDFDDKKILQWFPGPSVAEDVCKLSLSECRVKLDDLGFYADASRDASGNSINVVFRRWDGSVIYIYMQPRKYTAFTGYCSKVDVPIPDRTKYKF